ncbi:DUF559 domain-containing protein [Tautonia sociabilis]|uniref:DUF559 domain-containing protein n=2 Tax=Tautonia sociabilis TaxID=2080755 RepID=A0A432MHN6_9BACT|nr:DUF559 domain-containing protein [Tautonia sociabilis]
MSDRVPPPELEPKPEQDDASRLDLHERLRASGIPTLSVLAGPPRLAAALVRRWARGRGRPVVRVDRSDRQAMALAWREGIGWGRDPVDLLADRLAPRLGRTAEGLADRLRGMTRFEREVFVRGLPDPEGPDDPIRAARVILDDGNEPRSDDPIEAIRAASALLPILPGEALPVVLVVSDRSGTEELDAEAAEAVALVEAEPRLTLCWAVAPGRLDHLLTGAAAGRVRDVVRAGVIPIASAGVEEIGRLLERSCPGASARLAGPIRRLASDGAPPTLVGRFLDAVSGPGPGAGPAGADASRSAAERFLFDRLESLPETAGLFRLNARLPIPWGSRADMEVDLSAASLGIALEIDGYFHFNDAESYRRDRRKDLALQQHGYLVLRVLADDVVPRLEDTLDTILDAVARRRAASPDPEGPTP